MDLEPFLGRQVADLQALAFAGEGAKAQEAGSFLNLGTPGFLSDINTQVPLLRVVHGKVHGLVLSGGGTFGEGAGEYQFELVCALPARKGRRAEAGAEAVRAAARVRQVQGWVHAYVGCQT